MENSSLNKVGWNLETRSNNLTRNIFSLKAHQLFRKADNLVKHRKFDEASECHKIAAEHLSEALRKAENPRAIESIKLQRDYHLRQKDIVLLKKEQYENYKKALEYKRTKMQALENKDSRDGSPSLQWAIYRTMEETDSLLGLLVKKGSTTNSDSESLKSLSASDTDDKDTGDGPNGSLILGNKHPKNDDTVIEELQILNEQLHTLVFQLVSQLDTRTKEVEALKERVRQLEADKSKSEYLKLLFFCACFCILYRLQLKKSNVGIMVLNIRIFSQEQNFFEYLIYYLHIYVIGRKTRFLVLNYKIFLVLCNDYIRNG